MGLQVRAYGHELRWCGVGVREGEREAVGEGGREEEGEGGGRRDLSGNEGEIRGEE